MEIVTTNTNAIATITNKNLLSATKRIAKCADSVKKNTFKIAVELVKIEQSEMFKDDFSSITDYCNEVFGLKKSHCYNLLKMGKKFISAETSETLLTHETGNDYTPSQVVALLPLNDTETAQAVCDEFDITPETPIRTIKKIVKEYTTETADTETETETADTETETETETETDTVGENNYYTITGKMVTAFANLIDELPLEIDGNRTAIDDYITELNEMLICNGFEIMNRANGEHGKTQIEYLTIAPLKTQDFTKCEFIVLGFTEFWKTM